MIDPPNFLTFNSFVFSMVVLGGPWWIGEKGGIVMYFEQADLLRGMDKPFIEKFMGIAIKDSHKKGYFLSKYHYY